MSDIQLKSEIESLLKSSGYTKSQKLLCPITKIIHMRYKEVSYQQIFKVAKTVF